MPSSRENVRCRWNGLVPTCDASARAAAPAFAEPGDLRRIRPGEELHRFTLRPPARTARPAVHAGRLHPVDEPAVAARITREHRLPEPFVGRHQTHCIHTATISVAARAFYPPLAVVITCRRSCAGFSK